MTTNTYKITRFKAFAIHIGISIAIFLCLLVLLLGYWYQAPFFDLEDGPRAIQIILFVDVVLGPVLTLIVFKPGKPGLKFDLSLIALFQLSALVYGIWMVQVARPVAVLLTYDALYVASYRTIKESEIPKAEIDKIIGLEPTYLYINLPAEQADFIAISMQALKESRAIELLYKYAEPLSLSNKKQTATIAVDIEKYTDSSPEWSAKLQHFLAENKRLIDTIIFLPIKARRGKFFLAIDKNSGEIIDYLDVPFVENLAIKARVAN